MTGSITTNLLDLTEGLRTQAVEASSPQPLHVETELQRLVSQRLDHTKDEEPVPRSRRVSRSLPGRMRRKATGAGAFDSPPGFVYVSDAVSHKRN